MGSPGRTRAGLRACPFEVLVLLLLPLLPLQLQLLPRWKLQEQGCASSSPSHLSPNVRLVYVAGCGAVVCGVGIEAEAPGGGGVSEGIHHRNCTQGTHTGHAHREMKGAPPQQ